MLASLWDYFVEADMPYLDQIVTSLQKGDAIIPTPNAGVYLRKSSGRIIPILSIEEYPREEKKAKRGKRGKR